MQIILGTFNLALGIIFLIIPIVFIELGRQKDLIKAFFLLIFGIALLISANSLSRENLFILVINCLLISLLVFEVFQNRWNQLSEKEKKQLLTFAYLKSKLIIFFDALKLTFQKIFSNFLKFKISEKKLTSKKWVRSENNSENKMIEKLQLNPSSINVGSTNNPKKDIIKDEKI
ncbi:MAG: hypothetical protein CMK49_03625 [Prochlorococcus sp. SP3034]|nr:hypothetical protein [Prochlorococcus sp. SP3034]